MTLSPFHFNMPIDTAIDLILFMQPVLGEAISLQPSRSYDSYSLSAPSSMMFPDPRMNLLR